MDVFGVAFTVDGGFRADLWGDGDLFGPGTTTYGVGVMNSSGILTSQFAGVSGSAAAVPEPSTWLLMLMGVGGLGYGLRRARRLTRTGPNQASAEPRCFRALEPQEQNLPGPDASAGGEVSRG